LLGTQTPSKDVPGHGEPAAIAARNEVNDWIRTSGVADGVVDFHAALRDPGDPDQLLPAFDSGDHLHPSSAGYEAMAPAADLTLITGWACPPGGRSAADDRVLLADPERRARQVDETPLVLEQRQAGGAPGWIVARGQQVVARVPPQLRHAVECFR